LQQPHPALQAVPRHVTRRDIQRRGTDITGIDLHLPRPQRRGDGDAAAASAQVQHPPQALWLHPGPEIVQDQLGNRRARHQHLGADLELVAGKPRPAGQVGQWSAGVAARLGQTPDGIRRDVVHLPAPVLEAAIERRLHHVQHQPGRFVSRIVGAVAEMQAGRVEPRRDTFDPLRHRLSAVLHHIAAIRCPHRSKVAV